MGGPSQSQQESDIETADFFNENERTWRTARICYSRYQDLIATDLTSDTVIPDFDLCGYEVRMAWYRAVAVTERTHDTRPAAAAAAPVRIDET